MFEFQVSGMTCRGCASRVKCAVQSVDPQAEVNIDLENKRIQVHANADAGAIKTAISDAGYPVAEVSGITNALRLRSTTEKPGIADLPYSS